MILLWPEMAHVLMHMLREARELEEANVPIPEGYKGLTKSFTLPAMKYGGCPAGSSIGIMPLA